jgi:hypothetical protein
MTKYLSSRPRNYSKVRGRAKKKWVGLRMLLAAGVLRVREHCVRLRREVVRVRPIIIRGYAHYHHQVVKLFNAIQQSQASAAAAEKEMKDARGSGKPTLPAPTFDKKSKPKKGKNKDNPLGGGKECKRACEHCDMAVHIIFHGLALDKDKFMDMIRSGGTVSKT